MSLQGAGPQDAGTVPVRVQVIDTEPFALDLVVPTYLSAGDLSQRVARDAGLGAYWADGTRRLFWLRARGRVLSDDERLDDLGIVPHELLHVLPQPPEGAGVEERPPEYPETKGYAAAGTLNIIGGLTVVLLWTVGWSLALMYTRNFVVGLVPAVGVALLSVSFARHLIGGAGSSFKIPLIGLGVYLPMLGMVGIPAAVFADADPVQLLTVLAPAFIAGMFGVMLGWLAWYGPVEPLPKRTTAQARHQEAVAVYDCGICGLPVPPEVRADCQYACGKVFHVGCFQARVSVYNGPGCAVCGYVPA